MKWLDRLLGRRSKPAPERPQPRPWPDPVKIEAEQRRSALIRRIDALETQLRAETRLRRRE